MSKRENDTHRLKDLIPHMLEENKLQKGMDQMNVKEAWAEVMGKGVVSYTESVSVKNRIIFVKLNSSALREELAYGKDKIILMLNEKLGNLKLTSIKLL